MRQILMGTAGCQSRKKVVTSSASCSLARFSERCGITDRRGHRCYSSQQSPTGGDYPPDRGMRTAFLAHASSSRIACTSGCLRGRDSRNGGEAERPASRRHIKTNRCDTSRSVTTSAGATTSARIRPGGSLRGLFLSEDRHQWPQLASEQQRMGGRSHWRFQ